MYRILNPLNHNVALVRNDKGEELIVIGKGIIFGKKKGDLVPKEKVEKLFRMKTEESRENFMTLLKDVPLDFITVTYEMIDYLSKKYHYPVQEYIYVTLTDHMFCSYQAVTQGRYKESNLLDISENYPVAFEIAKEAVDIYREKSQLASLKMRSLVSPIISSTQKVKMERRSWIPWTSAKKS